jgi:hypothetical protein
MNITDIRVFKANDFEESKRAFNDFVNGCPRVPEHNVIAFYFDDEEDAYSCFYRRRMGEDKSFTERKDFYSWDELSAYIYERT